MATAFDQGVLDSFRPSLEKVRKGKSATIAKKWSQLTPSGRKRTIVLMEALQGRVARAERWQRASEA
jgi:hypothetical protein